MPRAEHEDDPVWSCFGYGPGVCIQYERQGSGPTPILLLHGFAASRSTWDDLKTRFPAELYNLYLIDLMGFGRSSKPRDGEYGPEEQAATLLAFLADRRLSGVVLLGHSYGGTIALLTTLMARRSAWQHLIAGIVLIGAPAWPQRLPRFFRYLKAPFLGSIILNLLPNRFVVKRALESVYYDRKLVDDRHIERYADCFRGAGTINALVRTVRQMVPDHWEDFCAEYPRLDKPLLLIWGRHDRVVKLRQGERLRNTIPGAHLAIIDRCGHNPHEEHPDETWRSIQLFLEGITRRRL
jgi:pimeloyl-ACP methyl ester carboxylesterase